MSAFSLDARDRRVRTATGYAPLKTAFKLAESQPGTIHDLPRLNMTDSSDLSVRIAEMTISRRIGAFISGGFFLVGLVYSILLAHQHLAAIGIVCGVVGGLLLAPDALGKSGAVTLFGRACARIMLFLSARNSDPARAAVRREHAENTRKTVNRYAVIIACLCSITTLAGLLVIVFAHNHQSTSGAIMVGSGYLVAIATAVAWYLALVRVAVIEVSKDIDKDYEHLQGELETLTVDRSYSCGLVLILIGACIALAATYAPSNPSRRVPPPRSHNQEPSSQYRSTQLCAPSYQKCIHTHAFSIITYAPVSPF
jgi:hypothetical protein